MKSGIFVVEDDSDVFRLVRHHLEADGFAVEVFSTGNAVIGESERQRPSLFILDILDIMLPGQDGVELCRQIRQIPSLAPIAVIFLTAKSGEADRIFDLELGTVVVLAEWLAVNVADVRIHLANAGFALFRFARPVLPSGIALTIMSTSTKGCPNVGRCR